jgi:4-hydroxybenzoate polyprenyltransferase
LLVTAGCAVAAASGIGFARTVAVAMVMLWLGAAGLVGRFLRRPVSRRAGLLEHFSGLWTLGMYASLGLVPVLLRSKEP